MSPSDSFTDARPSVTVVSQLMRPPARKVLIIEKLSFLPSPCHILLFLQALDHLDIPRSTLIWYVLSVFPGLTAHFFSDRTNLALIHAGELASI